MTTSVQTASLQSLSEDDCWALLSTQQVGRLGIIVEDRPLVLPVNFGLQGHTVVIRTAPGTKLAHATLDRACFEVDALDHRRRQGWSVLVQGVAVAATEGLDSESLADQLLNIESWAPGDKPEVIRLVHPEISGRRIGLPPPPPDGDLIALAEEPVQLAASSSLRQAVELMGDSGRSCLLVGHHSPPWILTEDELARALCAGMDPDEPIDSLATTSPVWATPTTSVEDAVRSMVNHGLRHLLVVGSDGQVVGVVEMARLLRSLAEPIPA